MPVYAKMRGEALVLPTSYATGKPLGSIYVDGPASNALTYRDHSNVDTPLIGGSLDTAQVLIKRKKNLTGVLIPAEAVVALLPDGSIRLAESDVLTAITVIGTTLEPIAHDAYGSILLIGASAHNVVSGMGFSSGDIIYTGSEPGVLTNNIADVGGALRIIGIADCPTDIQSSVASDLILSTSPVSSSGGQIFITASTPILRGYPVAINTSGLLAPIDLTSEESAYAFCGVSSVHCLIGGTASVLAAGQVLYDIPLSFGITSFGKPVFVAHSGALTLAKPDVGVGDFQAGDFILHVGVTTKNVNTGSIDLIVNPKVVGQLSY